MVVQRLMGWLNPQDLIRLPPRTALLFIGGWEVLIGLGLLFTHPLVFPDTPLHREGVFTSL